MPQTSADHSRPQPRLRRLAPPMWRKPSVKDPSDTQTEGVSHIRIWNADTYTRIIIDLGDQAKYQTARISNPDRIYFDIENARLEVIPCCTTRSTFRAAAI